jgi:hypothetical protein
MKKWMLICMIWLMCGVLALTVGAAQTDALPDGHFATSDELYQYWNSTYPPQYPDYVGGVWTDNGTTYPLTFALTDDEAGQAGKQEILRLIADDASVKFTEVSYSRNLLTQVMDEISHYFDRGIGLVGLGVYDMENCVGLEIHQDYKNAAETQDLVRDLKARYGDAVKITYTDGYVAMTEDVIATDGALEPEQDKTQGWLVIALLIAAIAFLGTACAGIFVYRRRRQTR